MSCLMWARLLGVGIAWLLGMSATALAAADAFVVEVSPSEFAVGEAVDLVVTVVDEDGNTVDDYDGDIFVTVNVPEGDDAIVPSDGIYTFVAEDQGVKTFSKGLIINVSGEYSVTTEDILGEVTGSAPITVTGDDDETSGGSVTITSPSDGTSVESAEALNVIGTSDVPNTPVFVTVNGTEQATDLTTDGEGAYNVYVNDLNEGDNELVVILKSDEGDTLATSSPIGVVYAPTADDGGEESVDESGDDEPATDGDDTDDGIGDGTTLLDSFFVQPQQPVVDGIMTMGAITDTSVTRVTVSVGPNEYVLEEVAPGQFGKEAIPAYAGVYTVTVSLEAGGNSYILPQDPITVIETTETFDAADSNSDSLVSIGLIRHENDPLDPGTVRVTWDAVGDIQFFLVRYGDNAAFLDNEIVVVNTGVTLTSLEVGKTVYVQVWPADNAGQTIGSPSDPLSIEVGEGMATCVVKGIELTTEERGTQRFLVWEEVEGAKEYVVYRSDYAVSLLTEMTEIARTSETSYPYPFDVYAEQDEFAYFAVEAVCQNDMTVPIDAIKRLQVGPATNMIAILLLALLGYFLWRINYYQGVVK